MKIERGLIARRQPNDQSMWLVYREDEICGRFKAQWEWMMPLNELPVEMRTGDGVAEVSFVVNDGTAWVGDEENL